MSVSLDTNLCAAGVCDAAASDMSKHNIRCVDDLVRWFAQHLDVREMRLAFDPRWPNPAQTIVWIMTHPTPYCYYKVKLGNWDSTDERVRCVSSEEMSVIARDMRIDWETVPRWTEQRFDLTPMVSATDTFYHEFSYERICALRSALRQAKPH